MNRFISQVRKPVKRQRAESYLLITLLSFAASVAFTRLFLEITGYPQLGGGDLHIAHVLWGGLLLFIAALLPLILANRWVYIAGALLAGVGVGLFIDEVGKFITQNNDYFYPAAAPIIYAFFLLTVLLYLQVRRSPPRDTRTELYHALDALEEVLDHDLEPEERADLEMRLHLIANQDQNPQLARLAKELLDFLGSPEIYIAPDIPSHWERLQARLSSFEARFMKPHLLRAVLIGGLGGLSLVSLFRVIILTIDIFNAPSGERTLAALSAASPITNFSSLYWFFARVSLEGFVALLLLAAAIFIYRNQFQRGLSFSYYGLLLSLTTVNLLVFYFDQFSTIIPASIQFGLLLGVIYYRRNFLPTNDSNKSTS